MSISLTPDQESFIYNKLKAGKYSSVEEILETALKLLDEYDSSEAEWVEAVRKKIDAAVEISKHTPAIDGEAYINGILERFQQSDRI